MNTQQPAEPPIRRIDRILAFTSLSLMVAAVLCFIATIVATPLGADFGNPIWIVVSAVSIYGLILGMALLFTLLIMNMARRSKATKQAGARKR